MPGRVEMYDSREGSVFSIDLAKGDTPINIFYKNMSNKDSYLYAETFETGTFFAISTKPTRNVIDRRFSKYNVQGQPLVLADPTHLKVGKIVKDGEERGIEEVMQADIPGKGLVLTKILFISVKHNP